jgi:uncharacterized membrane protein
MSALALAIHSLVAIIWVGGMFFAYMILRPSMPVLEPPPQRLKLWLAVFERFFPWVWGAVIALPVTGYYQVFTDYGGLDGTGPHIHLMQAGAGVMILLFWYLYFGPYAGFKAAVSTEDWPTAAGHLNTIRRIVGTNLILGLITAAAGASGRLWML